MKLYIDRKIATLIVLLFVCSATSAPSSFKLGIENFSSSWFKKICPDKKKASCAFGLITNQTGVDQQGTRTIDIVNSKGATLRYIFAPEHGLTGIIAERDVHDTVDKKTGIPIISLYGNGSGKMIASEYMNNIDLLMFDIQDSGMRHYTYISTLLSTMKIAAQYNKKFVVFDRPNPLGGIMEGPMVEQGLISFISIASIPLRHGMTIGELARYFNTNVLEKPIELYVVKMSGYDRMHWYMEKIIHPLSPNLQSVQSCYGYSFLGLLGEIEPFDVGIGTPMAFRCIMLPESLHVPSAVWQRLHKLLSSYGVKSFAYHHHNKKNKKMSRGLRLEFAEIGNLRAFELFIAIMQFFKKGKIVFSFSAAFNKAVGSCKVQELIVGTLPKRLFFNQLGRELHQFHKRAHRSLCYGPAPVIPPRFPLGRGIE